MSKDKKRPEKGCSIIAFPAEYVVIDIETTGLSPVYDSIIELSAIRYKDGAEIESFSSLAKPETSCTDDCGNLIYIENPYITLLTGITNEMLAQAPPISEVLKKYIAFIGNSIVLGHNVGFDVNFIYDNCISILGVPFTNDFINTMRFANKLLPSLSSKTLVGICNYFKIIPENMHRSLNDCRYTYQIYQKMCSMISSQEDFISSFKKHSSRIDIKSIVPNSECIDMDNPIYGKTFVFTGKLDNMPRKEAMQLVVDCGGNIGNFVTKTTNYLVLGCNDYCSSIKDGKSSKQKKAEEYKLKNIDIEIISEDVFFDMLNMD